MYQVSITRPITSETIEVRCRNAAEIVKEVNDTLFSGCDVIKKQQLYNYMSRRDHLKTQKYYDNIKITKVIGVPVTLGDAVPMVCH